MVERPRPPDALADGVVVTLEDCSPALLREVSAYTEELAAYREQEQDEGEEDEADVADLDEDLPDEVPSRATLTVKEINDNRYYYWQWRADNGKIKSKYIRPVNPEE